MMKNKWKAVLQKIAVICTSVFCACSFSSLLCFNAEAAEEEVFFDLLEGAIFDDDASKRLTYDTSSRSK